MKFFAFLLCFASIKMLSAVEILQAVVDIKTPNLWCKGTVVGPRAVLTPAYCTGQTLTVETGGKSYPATRIIRKPSSMVAPDLAIVRTSRDIENVKPLSAGGFAYMGSPIDLPNDTTKINIISPDGADVFSTAGHVIDLYPAGSGIPAVQTFNYGVRAVVGILWAYSQGNSHAPETHFSRLDRGAERDFITEQAKLKKIAICGITMDCEE